MKRNTYENRILVLRAAIKEGLDSGIDKTFNAKKHLKSLKVSKRKNG